VSRYWSPFVHQLVPYVPGEQPKIDRLVKLNTNENPYGPSPRVVDAIAAANDDALRLYPDPEASRLKQAIASYYGLNQDRVFVGNGSDEVLAHAFFGFFKQRQPILFPDISYSFYEVYCGLYGIQFDTVPLAEDFSIALESYRRANGGIVFPNPNAPTGCAVPRDAIERLLTDNTSSLVIVDEAYVDFGAESSVPLIESYPNLLVVQTVSKARSLAGLRVGFALGQPALIEGLERVKNSFNSYPLGRLAIAGGVAAFEDVTYFEDVRQRVIVGRERLRGELTSRHFDVLPSAANFLFARHRAIPGGDLAARLRQHGVIVRRFTRPSRITDYVRISVGTDQQHQRLLEALDAVVSGAAP
jgi:histidinol-phosphate aminotransferase